MSKQRDKIPANIITGFLGVGKTTAIQQLLKYKPENEVWGVLVNEFGQIGIDGTLLSAFGKGLQGQEQGIVVKEVPGGCLCCVAGLPMKMGLNMLITKSRPDRILIEPTGLGHLQQVIIDLTGEFYCDILELKATICLINPLHLAESKYLDNEYFQDQINLADVLVANKTELLDTRAHKDFMHFCAQLLPPKAQIAWTSYGDITPNLLALPLDKLRSSQHLVSHLKHTHEKQSLNQLEQETDPRFVRNHASGQGLFSYGWIFSAEQCFNLMSLAELLEPLQVIRLKATLITEQGCFAINSVHGDCEFTPIAQLAESKIELIAETELQWLHLEQALCGCLVFVSVS
ncbi:MAG: G3E family GTPase [Moritella sp.]|jgi:G3E family GTPase